MTPVSKCDWSFIRSVLSQGMAIQKDWDQGLKYLTYEHLSARLDEAARERMDALEAAPVSPARDEDARDAARYRYLRDTQPSDFAVQQSYPKIWNSCHGPEMDDAIDCAIARAAIDAARNSK